MEVLAMKWPRLTIFIVILLQSCSVLPGGNSGSVRPPLKHISQKEEGSEHYFKIRVNFKPLKPWQIETDVSSSTGSVSPIVGKQQTSAPSRQENVQKHAVIAEVAPREIEISHWLELPDVQLSAGTPVIRTYEDGNGTKTEKYTVITDVIIDAAPESNPQAQAWINRITTLTRQSSLSRFYNPTITVEQWERKVPGNTCINTMIYPKINETSAFNYYVRLLAAAIGLGTVYSIFFS